MTRNLSIIIPHYQKQESLKKVHSELILQINPNEEIIIVDDHSPDGVPEFDCLCTKVIRPEKHTPHIYRLNTLRNLGVQHAKYDPCIILDPDCVPNPHFLNNARNMFDPSILYGGCIDKVQEDGSIKPDMRRNENKSYWCDLRDKRGGGIFGGCMLFSKSRTEIAGWFDTEYDGVWGAEDADFACRCYHSGMRLRFSMELLVIHQYHEHWREGYKRNKNMWLQKSELYRKSLNKVTPYKPAVGIMVITLLRPELINQCMQSIFRNRLPVKVRLINNGDDGEETRKICKQWGDRWAVDYTHHPRKWPAQVRNDTMKWAKNSGFKYLIFIDDDMLLMSDALPNLVKAIMEYPEYYAISGYQRNHKGNPERCIGGPTKTNKGEIGFYNLPVVPGIHPSDWVGGGLTIHKLDPMVFYDEEYETGFNDFDWSMIVKSRGLKTAVTGDAGTYHNYLLTADGLVTYKNPPEYQKLRYDSKRHEKMNERFEKKWGYKIGRGGMHRG